MQIKSFPIYPGRVGSAASGRGGSEARRGGHKDSDKGAALGRHGHGAVVPTPASDSHPTPSVFHKRENAREEKLDNSFESLIRPVILLNEKTEHDSRLASDSP